jgi:hypothetical protein
MQRRNESERIIANAEAALRVQFAQEVDAWVTAVRTGREPAAKARGRLDAIEQRYRDPGIPEMFRGHVLSLLAKARSDVAEAEAGRDAADRPAEFSTPFTPPRRDAEDPGDREAPAQVEDAWSAPARAAETEPGSPPPPPAGAPPVPRSCTLEVRSVPDGARLFVDGAERGTTPVTLENLDAGVHTVMVILTGYETVKRELTLAPGRTEHLALTLVRKGVAAAPRPRPAEPAPPAAPPGPAAAAEEPKTIDGQCPACTGSGRMRKIGCVTCRGTGYVELSSCAKCQGAGAIDYACPLCSGAGQAVSGGKMRECRGCKGGGNLFCMVCKGKGTIPRRNPAALSYPTRECAACKGSGFDESVDCTFCRGSGKITISKGDVRLLEHAHSDLRLVRRVTCIVCNGRGKGHPVCPRCRGKRYLPPDRNPQPCVTCTGTGHVFQACRVCKGLGVTRDRR